MFSERIGFGSFSAPENPLEILQSRIWTPQTPKKMIGLKKVRLVRIPINPGALYRRATPVSLTTGIGSAHFNTPPPYNNKIEIFRLYTPCNT